MSLGSGDIGHAGDYEKPVPRPPKSPTKLAQLQRQNRRREYFRRNPSYLRNLDHELADPVLYGRLVKKFQSAAERKSEGEAKGYGRTLEADLVRGETRLVTVERTEPPTDSPGPDASAWEENAESKEHGLELWHAFLEERFIQGRDDDFDYVAIDTNDDLDVVARSEAEDAWFEQEDPAWAFDDSSAGNAHARCGETGIQDF